MILKAIPLNSAPKIVPEGLKREQGRPEQGNGGATDAAATKTSCLLCLVLLPLPSVAYPVATKSRSRPRDLLTPGSDQLSFCALEAGIWVFFVTVAQDGGKVREEEREGLGSQAMIAPAASISAPASGQAHTARKKERKRGSHSLREAATGIWGRDPSALGFLYQGEVHTARLTITSKASGLRCSHGTGESA